MNPLFVDTSAFVALVDRKDRQHASAKRLLRGLARKRRSIVTSTYVVDELITLVRMRLGHAAAVRVGGGLLETDWCRVIDVTDETRVAAWQVFVHYDDQLFSFTDCTSFALMRAMQLTEAFTFDRRDYGAAGFTTVP